MMSMKPLIALAAAAAALVGAAGPARATPLTMDFNALGYGAAPTTYTEDGIKLDVAAPAGSTLINLGTAPEYKGYALNTSDAGTLTFSLVDGGAFDLESFDVATQYAVTYVLEGVLAGGGTVSTSFTWGNGNEFLHVAALAGFSDLTSFTLAYPTGGGVMFIDNIVLDDRSTATGGGTVPEPASLSLTALALTGAGWAGRRGSRRGRTGG